LQNTLRKRSPWLLLSHQRHPIPGLWGIFDVTEEPSSVASGNLSPFQNLKECLVNELNSFGKKYDILF
jgi:hypothetical protein